MRTWKAVVAVMAVVVVSGAVYAQSKGPRKLTGDDFMEILQIYSKYNWSTDSRNGRAKAELFVPDGVFQVLSTGRTEVGHEKLTASVNRELGPATPTSALHFVTNIFVEPISDNEVHGGAYLLNVVSGGPGKPAEITASVYYEDWLVKTPDGWRL